MKHKFLYLATIFVVCCMCGCQETSEDIIPNELAETEVITINMNHNGFYDSKEEEGIVTYKVGKYIEYMAPSDYVIGLSSLKSTPLAQEDIRAFLAPGSEEVAAATKSGMQHPVVYIDGIDIFGNETKSTAKGDMSELYGRKISISVASSAGSTKAGIDGEGHANLYVPKLIQIENPVVSSGDEEYPLCYYRDFVLEWNRDDDNSNGVMVAVEWTGTMIFGESHPDAYIRNTGHFDDTGVANLPKELFEGIPDTALCLLTILRGDIDNIVVDESSYKVYGESHAVLPFILIREIQNIN